MEISNETKFKVALQYYGCDFLICYNIENNPVIEKFAGRNADFGIYMPDPVNKRDLLILKPLSAITDEDSMEVAKLAKCKYCIGDVSDLKPHLLRAMSHENVWSGNTILNICQFLQSKGYDLPQNLLGGKTLQQSGLATYEN